MSNGILCFANNNGKIDYLKQAIFLANRAKQYLNLPVSIATSSKRDLDYLYKEQASIFDHIIEIPDVYDNTKRYYNGSLNYEYLLFKNYNRTNSYNLSPYNKTLVMDTDVIICNDSLSKAFNMVEDFQIYRHCVDLCDWRDSSEFNFINDIGIPFYWATCFYFKKTANTKIFFDLMKHLEKNWIHYSRIYNLGSKNFRNDHIFSIAIHMMNGYEIGDWAKCLPGKLFYTLDRDQIYQIKDNKLKFLVEKENRSGEYTLASTNGSNVHVMNKFSLEKVI
tara:strand:- start:17 stop:850 length:834 start_codon:yes stop_codon:yes gene_type:complete